MHPARHRVNDIRPMPYYVYRIGSAKDLEQLAVFPNYKEARALTRARRQEMEPGTEFTVRIMFAKDEIEAEKLLTAPRAERVIGED